ncbi:hypothetical protein E4634_17880 [Mangrovimicrobium sediminis]|uniref:PEP-CTERM sorting domain-containing protein n=1 Tax=Mangrovimicrobium sediminis TaxID=2562682 RepID=A0A4Z0LW23_9GAMM|nr:hypothetical protein [Haliea sp. SAOS-164]TGD71522.1 hypothetical protein E4634_17880 [Haliea sp. SAOS-164]
MIKQITSVAALVAVASVSQVASAAPFSMTWTSTVSIEDTYSGYVGESATITVVVDNGGTSNVSQVWATTDIVSLTFSFGHATTPITTVFDPNGGGNFAFASGQYQTDGTGALTAVPSMAGDEAAPTTNDPINSSLEWFVNGLNGIYYSFPMGNGFLEVNNVGTNTDPGSWSNPAPVAAGPAGPVEPVPALPLVGLVMAALGLGAAGAAGLRRKQARS